MAAVSESDVKYDDMACSDLLREVKKIVSVLEKKTKKMETTVAKVEEKKAKSAPKGVVPRQLEHNLAWVEFVWDHVLANGWESFHHSERLGSQMVDLICDGSEIQEAEIDGKRAGIHAFVDSDNLQPTRAHAMSLSKLYRTSRPDLYEKFLEVNPVPEAQAKPAAAAVVRPSMTMAEVKAAREEAKAKKDAEKAAAKAKKAEEKAAKDAAKAAKVPKAAKVVKAVVVRKIVPAKGAGLSPKVVSKVVKAKAVDDWVAPADGESRKWKVPGLGLVYWRDNKDRLFLVEDDDSAGDCIGWWTGKMISDDDIPRDDSDSEDEDEDE